MERMIAMCGIVCTDCPAFIATQMDDDEERKRVVERWSSYGVSLRPEDVHCDGCLAIEGKLIYFCRDCEVRQCGFERDVANCAHCGAYPCPKLERHLLSAQAPEARVTLEEIRRCLEG